MKRAQDPPLAPVACVCLGDVGSLTVGSLATVRTSVLCSPLPLVWVSTRPCLARAVHRRVPVSLFASPVPRVRTCRRISAGNPELPHESGHGGSYAGVSSILPVVVSHRPGPAAPAVNDDIAECIADVERITPSSGPGWLGCRTS